METRPSDPLTVNWVVTEGGDGESQCRAACLLVYHVCARECECECECEYVCVCSRFYFVNESVGC